MSSIVNIVSKKVVFRPADSVLTLVSTSEYNNSAQANIVTNWYKEGVLKSSTVLDLGFLKLDTNCMRWNYEYKNQNLLWKESCYSCQDKQSVPLIEIEYFYEFW